MDFNIIIIIISIPLISSIIGWFTNYIAIKSLFKPTNQIKILGFKIQGVIPKRQKILAKKIAKVVSSHLISTQDLKDTIKTKKNIANIKKKFHHVVSKSILESLPSFIQPTAQPIIDKILEMKGEKIIVDIIDGLVENMDSYLDIEELIENKLIEYDVDNLEKIIESIAKKELKHIELLGAVIGFIIGIFQVFLFIFLN